MGEALREAYHDIFLITSSPKDSDKEAVKGKFKSFHNASDNTAQNMTQTFYALLKLAEFKSEKRKMEKATEGASEQPGIIAVNQQIPSQSTPSFHYNIQVHLPATKDVEVYNAIFKSLRDHFVG